MAYEFIMPGRVVMGRDALDRSKNCLRHLGSRALIVTDSVMVKLGNLDILKKALDEVGLGFEVYPEINGEPTDIMVAKGLDLFYGKKCDCLIALGGGSPIDAMKAIGALAGNGGQIADYLGKEIIKPTPPMAAAPTTAGTGSEATQFTIITDTEKQIKMLLRGSVLMPDLAVIDPQFTLTAPPAVTAATGLDALTHAIEAYTSRKATALSDTYALSAVKRIVENLPLAFEDGGNEAAREEMSLASFEAGVAFNNASVTVVHGMSRPIGALFHVPHGISNAMLLKVCLSCVLDGAYERFAELGRVVGAAGPCDNDEAAGDKFLKTVEKICDICKIPTLEGYGINRDKFFKNLDRMADDALASGSPSNTRKKLGKEDILMMYRRLWE